MNAPHLPAPVTPAPPPGRRIEGPGPASAPWPATAVPDPVDGWWSLLYRGWTLQMPSGARLDLTEIERACFVCMLKNPRGELLRDEIKAIRGGTDMRTLNVAICRLRGKVRRSGARLPLHTVHGVGYAFLGNLRELSSV
ncbi:hypothetical protein D3C85_1124990 [compost metagenome]|jgi:hypothetical protein